LDGGSETTKDKGDLLRKTHQIVEPCGINILGVPGNIQVRSELCTRRLGNAQKLVKFRLPGSFKSFGDVRHD
jgi:hypothetical protein